MAAEIVHRALDSLFLAGPAAKAPPRRYLVGWRRPKAAFVRVPKSQPQSFMNNPSQGGSIVRKDEVEIVLVEDNPSDAELITRSLKKHHLANKITLLKDGAEALDFLFSGSRKAVTPKVVLLDIKLPKVDGLEVLRRMKSEPDTKDIPVVILTSSNQERDIEEAYKLGVNSFVTKPIRFNEFAKVVADLGLYWLMLNVPPVR